ncbi:Multidrug export protein MepA [Clostridium liquoris]|uniref:Multidrug export protein MepA n=1 Tax=Clostridium liquoris TaxID=1289519 RepID=A0A2T0B7A3_9CLOT|nr:MATE family efflux transporter [Clostridium liquoris]PRR79693.1 Multidrug export protein MepA [Clostridium liquoris]
MAEQGDLTEEKTRFIGEGDIKKVLIHLSIPAIVAMLISAIYNLTDTAFIGMLHDTSAIGAVSVAFPIFLVIAALGQGIGVGSASYISRCLGSKKNETANKTASTAVTLSIIIGVLCAVFGLIFMEDILALVGASPTIMPYAKDYSRPLIFCAVFNIINMTLNNIIRAEGGARYSMVAITIGAVLNIILDPIFIFPLGMGVRGAAIATVIGQAFSTVYLVLYFTQGKSALEIHLKDFSLSKDIYEQIVKIGVPAFLMQFLASFSISLLNNAAVAYGDAAVAATGITIKLNTLLLYVLIGYGQGFQPVVGYNYGAKKYDRVREAIKISLIWTTAFSIISTVAFSLCAEPLTRAFSKDPEVIKVGADFIIAVGVLRPLLGFQIVYLTLFQALGKSKQATTLAIGRQGLFLIAAIMTLPTFFQNHIDSLGIFTKILPYKLEPGLYGVIYSQFAADALGVILTLIFASRLKKELAQKKLAQQAIAK